MCRSHDTKQIETMRIREQTNSLNLKNEQKQTKTLTKTVFRQIGANYVPIIREPILYDYNRLITKKNSEYKIASKRAKHVAMPPTN